MHKLILLKEHLCECSLHLYTITERLLSGSYQWVQLQFVEHSNRLKMKNSQSSVGEFSSEMKDETRSVVCQSTESHFISMCMYSVCSSQLPLNSRQISNTRKRWCNFKSSKNEKLFNASKEFHISHYFHLLIFCGN